MPIIVNSPYSGLPVKVRDQDVNRALRDEEGRVFYAVPRSDGSGYYGSPTRQGSAKDEQRAAELAAKMAQSHKSGAEESRKQIHDATGKRRGGLRRLVILLIIFAAIVAGVWFFLFRTPQGASMREQLPEVPGLNEDTPPSPSGRLDTPTPDAEPSAIAIAPPWITTATGLRYRIDEPGHAQTRAAAGRFVRVQYTLTTPGDATVLERAGDDGRVGFVLWSGQAMRAWDEAIAGMREGEVRTLLVPRDRIDGDWPGRTLARLPDGPLQFEIALLEVLPGVTHDVLTPGDGRIALPGDAVEMQFVASIAGTDRPYDNSYERAAPLRFRIGTGQVIPGWELGVAGMREGEKRRLTIPSYLAYGSRGAGTLIPPDATLNVDVELVRILPDDGVNNDKLSRRH